jgi:type IV pilus assembly protein PilP
MTRYSSAHGVRRRAPRQTQFWLALLLLGQAATYACGSDAPPPAKAKKGPASAPALAPAPAAAAVPSKSPAPAVVEVPPPKVDYQEEDFAETERSRDPFRSFTDAFVQKNERRSAQRQTVVLEQYGLEDLKLVGIVTGIEPARAMLVDPTGQGHVIHRNDLIGRAERVQGGAGATEFEINWRVERIRESDIVLVREDPANPDVPSATRVLALRPEDQK